MPELSTRRADFLAAAMAFFAILLPWINPFAGGPSASVTPWLFAAACAAVLLYLADSIRLALAPSILLGLFAVGALVSRWPPTHDGLAVVGGVLVVLASAVWASAQVGREGALERLAAAWVAAAVLSAVVALFQYFDWAKHFYPWMSVPSEPEAFSNLRQRNQFATLASLGVVSAVWWLGGGARWRWAVGLVALLALASAASASRTGIVQLVACALVLALWRGAHVRARLGLMAVALAVYALGALLMPMLQQSIAGVQASGVIERMASDLGCSSRKVLYRNVLDLIAQRPLAGWGWGELDHAHFMNLYGGPRFCDILDNAHNLPMHWAVELGLPLAMAMGLGWTALVLRERPWSESKAPRQLAWLALMLLAIHSMVEYPLWYGPFQITLGLAIGVLWPGAAAPPSGVVPAARPWLAPSLGALMLAASTYAQWDYHRVSQIYLAPESRSPAYRDDTLAKARASWLFAEHARFAELSLLELTPATAQAVYDLAGDMLHYSPEGKVVERRIEAGLALGKWDDVRAHLVRYRIAYPEEFQKWFAEHGPMVQTALSAPAAKP